MVTASSWIHLGNYKLIAILKIMELKSKNKLMIIVVIQIIVGILY